MRSNTEEAGGFPRVKFYASCPRGSTGLQVTWTLNTLTRGANHDAMEASTASTRDPSLYVSMQMSHPP